MLGVKRSHEAIRKWVHKFGASIWQVMPAKAGERVVVDETLVNDADILIASIPLRNWGISRFPR